MIPHFFVDRAAIGADDAVLDADDTRHLVSVLRARNGDPLSVSDGNGTVWSATYAGLSDGAARVVLGDRTEVALRRPLVTVVHALPKQRKLDDVVQRLTELGVHRIVPVHSRRSQVELDERKAAKAVTRWRAVALAAAKQSRRARIPTVADVGDWDTAFSDDATGVVCWEESRTALHAVLGDDAAPEQFVIAIGPEGGLEPAEVESTGLPHASLGPTILRTETAALVAAAAVSYAFGLMEPT